MMAGEGAAYPATLTFTPPAKIANWRPLVNWLLAIPHFIVLYFLGLVASVVAVISWFAIVFTGNLPMGLANVQMMYMRYWLRTYTFVEFLREDYPPFAFNSLAADPGDDPPVRVDFQPVFENRNRLTVAFRIILVIPQAIVLGFLFLAGGVCVLIGFFAVLFTGKWPEGLRDFVVKVFGWWLRVSAYALLLVDEYPPFALD
jgi:hypothetical protein